MAKKTLTVGVDTRLLDMMAGLDKSLTIRTALVNLFKLDPLTLIPLEDIEFQKRERELKLKVKPYVIPKTYAACVDDAEKIAFKEAAGFKLGSDPMCPDLWTKTRPDPLSGHEITSHWHYDQEIMQAGLAAMRCHVASKLGDEVDIPEGLI